MISRIFSLLLLSVLFIACNQQAPVKDYVTLSGTVSSPSAKRLLLKGPGFLREIAIEENGTSYSAHALSHQSTLMPRGDSDHNVVSFVLVTIEQGYTG